LEKMNDTADRAIDEQISPHDAKDAIACAGREGQCKVLPGYRSKMMMTHVRG
jgi:hypothetical protein